MLSDKNVCAKIPESLYNDIKVFMTDWNINIRENKKDIGLNEEKLTWDRVISEALNKWIETSLETDTSQLKPDPFLKLGGLVKTKE